MIPLNLPTLASNRVRGSADAGSLATNGERRIASKRVRFVDDDDSENRLTKRRRICRRTKERMQSDRRRQRSVIQKTREADENEDSSRMQIDPKRPWMDSALIGAARRHQTTTMKKTTTTYSEDDEEGDDDDDEVSSFDCSPSCDGKDQFPSIPIPDDPRAWSRLDVYNWLEHMRSREIDDLGDLDPGRFLMNGKALCLMTPAMFVYRVPRGGRILYTDFQARLCRAVAIVHHNNLI